MGVPGTIKPDLAEARLAERQTAVSRQCEGCRCIVWVLVVFPRLVLALHRGNVHVIVYGDVCAVIHNAVVEPQMMFPWPINSDQRSATGLLLPFGWRTINFKTRRTYC